MGTRTGSADDSAPWDTWTRRSASRWVFAFDGISHLEHLVHPREQVPDSSFLAFHG